MPWGGKAEPGRLGRRSAYPLALLLATALLAGCADVRQPPGEPSFVMPETSVPAETAEASPTAPATVAPAASATPKPSRTPSRKPTTAPPKTNLRYVFPVQTSNVSYHPTHGSYPATDIFANCGSPVVAATTGRILEVSLVDKYTKSGPQGPNNGGKAVSLLGDDGVRYYGSHLTSIASGIKAGTRVTAGQRLGTVGKTGNANNVCHLHFGISPPCQKTADWWIRRGVVWPASFLDAWRKKTNTSPASKVTAWHRDKGCPAAP